jgi:hypothetical protein
MQSFVFYALLIQKLHHLDKMTQENTGAVHQKYYLFMGSYVDFHFDI